MIESIDAATTFFDPTLFAETFLYILDKDKKLRPLRYNKPQQSFLSNRTGRDIILKARQLGFSTLIQAELFRQVITETSTTLTLTHLDTTTQALRRMADRFYDYLPMPTKPVRKYSNATVTTYSDYNSEAIIATAGSVNTGRGVTANHAHLSEVAFWSNADDVMASVLQTISANGTVVIESTANGASNWFYETCMEALDGNSTWKLHFFAWFDNPDYRLTLDAGEDIQYTADEAALVSQYNLVPEQIKWRRAKQKELKHLFIQEYPEDPKNCFLTSGLGYFGDIDHAFEIAHENVCDPAFRYTAGLDFGQQNDYTVCSIMDATNRKQVALLRINKLSWSEMRRRVVALCKQWGVTRLVAEKNSMGSTNIEELAKEARALDYKLSIEPFETTNESKASIMSAYREALHDGGLKLINDPDQKREHRAFTATQLPSGAWKLAGPDSEHDDTVIAGALSWYAVVAPKMVIGTW